MQTNYKLHNFIFMHCCVQKHSELKLLQAECLPLIHYYTEVCTKIHKTIFQLSCWNMERVSPHMFDKSDIFFSPQAIQYLFTTNPIYTFLFCLNSQYISYHSSCNESRWGLVRVLFLCYRLLDTGVCNHHSNVMCCICTRNAFLG